MTNAKPIGELLKNPGRRWSGSAPRLHDDLISELWRRMTEIFGHRWTSNYGDEPCDTWARGLHDVSAADLGMGIRQCVDSGADWPPSLAEFKRLCRPPKRENAAMYRLPPERQLPHKLSDEAREKGSAAIAELRKRLA